MHKKQEANEPHHSPEKQFQSITNLHKAMIIPYSEKKTLSPFWELNIPYLFKLPFTHGCFVPILVESFPVVLEKKILFPLGKGCGPLFEKNNNSFQSRMLCANFGWIWPTSTGEEDENVNSLQTDWVDMQAIRKAHLSFQLR